MPPPAFIRWHIPAQITQICPLRASHADRQDLRHIGGSVSVSLTLQSLNVMYR